MSVHKSVGWQRTAFARRMTALGMTVAVTSIMSAASAPVRLVGVSSQGNAVLIEATEPVAYSVTQPDPLTLVLDMRNVSTADARNDVRRQGAIAGVDLEQATAIDGRAVARIRVSLTRRAAYKVRSARNMIRVELTPAATGLAASATAPDLPIPMPVPVTSAAPTDARQSDQRATATAVASPPASRASDPRSQSAPVDGPAEPPDPMSALKLVAPPVERQAPPITMSQSTPSPVRSAQPPLERPAAPQNPVPPAQAQAPSAPPPALAAPPPAPAPQTPPTSTTPARQSAPPVQRTAAPQPPMPQLSSNSPMMGTGQGQKTFTGVPISLDFTGGDLRTVLRLFAEVSGLNMIIDPDVQGSVDIVLTDVPWDQALEVILRGNQLDYTVDGTIVRIARIETLKREQDSRQALAKAQADAGTLEVRTFPLSYARAAQAAPLVRKAALSPRGDVQMDERTNMLIITDLPARLETAATLLEALDQPEPQVEIEARIVSTSRDFSRAVGIEWGLNGRVSPQLGNTTPLAFPNNGSIGGRNGTQGAQGSDVRADPINQTGNVVNLPATLPAAAAIGLAMGSVNGAFNLDVALSAAESTGKVRVLSTPRVTTQNNVKAEMTQGVQIPVQTQANNTVTVTFKDAALTLRVTPQITAANTVIMQVELENASPGEEVQGIPSILTQRALTTVQVNDGATTIIGGVLINEERQLQDRVPALHKLPLLGWLFKRNTDVDDSRELLIFITPRILKG